MQELRFLGLDVHAETIAVAAAEPDGEGRSLVCKTGFPDKWSIHRSPRKRPLFDCVSCCEVLLLN
jgi:hypothetical protein